MDIRIGNDIRLNVAISDFDILEGETIKCAHCFLMCEAEKRLSDVDPKSIKLPTKYTLHNYGGRIYNVLPFNVQVRPCGGPGLFGKSLRQYGRPIYTRVSEEDGYIYGYFQEDRLYMLGDYYLVVMLVLDRNKYGRREKRHIVVDYGYVFTLTMDGDVCDPDGIYVSKQKDKQPNTITWDIDPSAKTYKIGDTVTFSAHAIDGPVAFNKQSPTTFTGDGMTITATSFDTNRYLGITDTIVLHVTPKTNNTIVWDVDPSSGTHYIGDVVNFSAHTVDGAAITFKDSNNNTISGITSSENVYSGSITLANTSTTIKAISSETEDHLLSTSIKTITATERPIPNLYAFSRNASAPAPSTSENLSNPDSLYTRTGQFTNGQMIDCTGMMASDSNSRFKMCWFAISAAKSLQIKDADSDDDITEDFTTAFIGDFKVYIKTRNVSDWSQLKIRLTIL